MASAIRHPILGRSCCAAVFMLAGAWSASGVEWAGHVRANTDNGFVAPSQGLEVVAESYPAGSADAVRMLVTTNGGESWQWAAMEHHARVGNNDRWRRYLGTYPEGTSIRYAIQVTGEGNELWLNNDGNDYRVSVSNEAAAVRWIGNTRTWPEYGSLDPGADLWINTEMWPLGVAAGAEVGYSTNDGKSWATAPMSADPPADGRDRWYVNLGGFPEGATIRYYIRAWNGSGDIFWDSNTGADYRMRVNSVIRDVYTDKGRHNPGDTVLLQVDLYNTEDPVSGEVEVRVKHLGREVASFVQPVTLPQWSGQTLTFPWVAPGDDFRGYGVEADWVVGGEVRDARSSAADVSSDWTRFPRYGFVSTYYAGEDAEAQAKALAKYHLNAIQFYDWKWTHDRLVPYENGAPADLYTQPDGRVQSFNTVKAKVAAMQARNMAAMSYTLMYGDSGNDGGPEHIEWAAFKTPFSTSPDDIRKHEVGYTIWVMDISNPGWKDHIIGQFRDAMDKAGFDGIHLDNLGGDWCYRYNSDAEIPEWEAFPQFIHEARESLRAVYPGARLAHNDVAENYRDAIAGSEADIYYTEVWLRNTYQEIRDGILGAKQAGNGKAVVLAAYINRRSWDEMSDPAAPPMPTYINDASAKLMAAAVFANGGFRIELGDYGDMLVNEYFPLRSPRMHPGLKRAMRDLYDFAVRYQNFLAFNTLGNVTDGTGGMNLSSDTHALSQTGDRDAIWTIARIWRDEIDALNLINLHGVDTEWRNPAAHPTRQTDVRLKYYVGKKVRQILVATPDDGLGRETSLPFEEGFDEGGYHVIFTVPELDVWSLVLVDQRTDIKVDGWPGDWRGTAAAVVHAVAVDQGEWIYRGAAGDHRTFGGATADSDITEVRFSSDDTYVYGLVRMQDITDPALPALGIAWRVNPQDPGVGYPWIGDASTPTASIGLDHAAHYASRQIMIYTPAGGSPTIRLWDGGEWYAPPSPDAAAAVRAEDDAIEFRIRRADLDMSDPASVTVSMVSFRGSGQPAGNNSTYDSPDLNNDGVDVMGGVTGVSANAWTRDLDDNSVGYGYELLLASAGAAPPPAAMTTDPASPTTCDAWVTIRYRANGRPLKDASQVYAHLGRNGWLDVRSPPPALTRQADGIWSFAYAVPPDTDEINVVFHDGAGTWDNNGGQDWAIPVAVCPVDPGFEVLGRPGSGWTFRFPMTQTGQVYGLEFTTNLVTGVWMPMNPAVPGDGGSLELSVTGASSTMSFRSHVESEPGLP